MQLDRNICLISNPDSNDSEFNLVYLQFDGHVTYIEEDGQLFFKRTVVDMDMHV